MAYRNGQSLILPDQILIDTLNNCLDILRSDYKTNIANNTEDLCILWLLFKGTTIGKYDMYANAVRVFVTTPQDPRHIDIKMSYDHTSQANAPTLFLTLPSESEKTNDLSIGVGDQEELVLDNSESGQPDQYREQYMRRYLANYHLVIIAGNRDEMIVLYNTMKSMITACMNHFALAGLSNLHIGGQDLGRISEVPDRLFRRAITMNFEYEQVVPSLVIKNIFTTINLYWKMQGATAPQGPIVIQGGEDLSGSSSFS